MLKFSRKLIARFALKRAELNRDAAWEGCGFHGYREDGECIASGGCPFCEKMTQSHINARNYWYQVYDRYKED